MDGTIYVKPERIRQYVIDLFGYYHVSRADAGMIADNLIDAEIRGVTTHGLTRIPLYTEKLISGLCDARAVPEIVRDYGATALIDAHDGLGQVAATKAMGLAIEKAEQFGVGYVGLCNGSHYGTAGYYAMMAEKRGMIGFSMTNSGAFVAPFGGVEKRLGTTPIAAALPADHRGSILQRQNGRRRLRRHAAARASAALPSVPQRRWIVPRAGEPPAHTRQRIPAAPTGAWRSWRSAPEAGPARSQDSAPACAVRGTGCP